MIEIKLSEEYQKFLPKLSPKDYEGLKNSIKDEGLHYPIVINKNGCILDGYHRYFICKELAIEPKYEVKNFDNELFEKKFVIEVNLKRRHLFPFQKVEVAMPLIKIEKELAKRRQTLGMKHPQGQKGRMAEIAAKKIGVAEQTLKRALKVMKKADKRTKQRLREGKTTVGAEYKKIVHKEKIKKFEEAIEKLPNLPDKKYQVIVIDPPWQHEGDYDANARRIIPAYPMLSIEEIANLKIPADENCVLWLWAPIKNLHDAFHIVKRWGFEPKTILTWIKDRLGIGAWLRGRTEHCILAVRGTPRIKLTNQSTALFGKAREHSRKPEEFYKLVDSLCIGKKLDYFGREERKGWDVYGTKENFEKQKG